MGNEKQILLTRPCFLLQGGTRKKIDGANDIKEFLNFSIVCYLFFHFQCLHAFVAEFFYKYVN